MDQYYELRPKKKYDPKAKNLAKRLKKRIADAARKDNDQIFVLHVDRTTNEKEALAENPNIYAEKVSVEYVCSNGTWLPLTSLMVTNQNAIDGVYEHMRKYINTHSLNRRHTRIPHHQYRIVRTVVSEHIQDVHAIDIDYKHTVIDLENNQNEKSI
jgi:hypothetical protein